MNKHTRVWSLQDAKAKFSEVVRLAQTEGPQLVTVHGREAVTISRTNQQDLAKLPNTTGADLWRALSSGPKFDLEIPERPKDGKFRDVSFE